MQYTRPLIGKLLTEPDQIEKAQAFSNDQEIIEYMTSVGVSRRDIISQMERYYGVNYVSLKEVLIAPEILKIFKVDVMKIYKFIPFYYDENKKVCHFAVANLADQQLQENLVGLCRQKGFSAQIFFAFLHELESKIQELEDPLYANRVNQMQEQLQFEKSLDIDDNRPREEEREAEDVVVGVIERVNRIINKGLELRASDIHIEPRDEGLQVRYRVDGILSLKELYRDSTEFLQGITSRIKIISGMDITERRRPQDGRIDNYVFNGKSYDIRVSAIGTLLGEKVVLRILDKYAEASDLVSLGFTLADEERIKKMLSSRNGIIYLGGATGTGKTTTLYSMIEIIKSDEINIYTIEDPVERVIDNINHIQVNPIAGITFASTLRSLLRQDPDVIVVGEIRDRETTELSIRASLTGHLVLTTVHANSATDVIGRIYDMGIEPYLISASALGFISQVLVRVLCPNCKELAEPDPNQRMWLEQVYQKYGVQGGEYYRPVGCSQCNNIGYRGRTAVAEIITVDDELKEMIVEKRGAKAIREKIIGQGFVPLELGVFEKIRKGVTSISEAMRVL